MAALRPPAATRPTFLPLHPIKALRQSLRVPVIYCSKKPALVCGRGLSSVFLDRKPRFSCVRVTEQGKMTELVRAPDGLVDGNWASGDVENCRPGKGEPIVLRNGSLEFRVDISSEGLESTLNKLSKWIVAVVFGIIIVWRHDGEVIWMAVGSVINSWLSTQLKQILNHQRPDPSLRSDPGMPSSHAQSIFYISTFAVVSLVDSLGFNTLTVTLGAVTLACSSYLSWLRISQKLHTASQIGVGAVVGTTFCLTCLWLWRAFVLEAFTSSVWVKIAVVIGAVALCGAFLFHVVQHWLKVDE